MRLHDLELAKRAEPVIAKAEEILEQLGSFDEIRRYYEAREIAIHDKISRITGAREEGKAEVWAEGQRKKSLQIARSLLDILDDSTISEKTGLTLEEVSRLRLQRYQGNEYEKAAWDSIEFCSFLHE